MIEDKINYYINRINNLRLDLDSENEYIFKYENILIKERKELSSRSFFSRLFLSSSPNHIKLISNILEEHNIKSLILEGKIKTTIDEFIKIGANSIIEDNSLNLYIQKYKLKTEEKEYLIQIKFKFSEIYESFKDTKRKLNRLEHSNGYGRNIEYKEIYNSFLNIIVKIITVKDIIAAYNIFEDYRDKINYSIQESLKNLEKIKSIDKLKELSNIYSVFGSVEINLGITLEVFNNICKNTENELLYIKEEEINLIKNNEIKFINNLIKNNNFDITKH